MAEEVLMMKRKRFSVWGGGWAQSGNAKCKMQNAKTDKN
jgi:hypothetical protein